MTAHVHMQDLQTPPLVAGDADSPAALNRLHFEDVADFQKLLHVATFDLTQTGRGPLHGEATILRLDDTRLVRERHRPATVWTTLFDQRLAVFVLPMRWHGELAYNGELALHSHLFRFSDASGYFGRDAQGGREVISAGLPRRHILETLAALRGMEIGEIALGNGALMLPDGETDHLRALLAGLIEHGATNPAMLADPFQVHGIAAAVETALLDAFMSGHPAPESRRPLCPSAIVRRAEEYFMEAPDRKVSLADLCAAAHVSAPTLYKAFDAVCDVTPLKYFRLRRLSLARATLLKAPPDRGKVKYAALGAGLTELGRFAAEYRALFGETPSTTLHGQASFRPVVTSVEAAAHAEPQASPAPLLPA